MNTTNANHTTTKRAPRPGEAPIDPDAFHYVTKDALAFGREFGVQVRAICGFWFSPRRVAGEGSEGMSETCRRCKEIHATLPAY